MEWIVQILVRTPWWVFALLAYLVSRGIRACRPADVTLYQLALVPALLTGWGLYDLARRYGADLWALAPWVLALAVGIAFGAAILRGAPFSSDRACGIVHRPADFTVLPLILLAFGIKYTFAVAAAISPGLLLDADYRLADLATSGFLPESSSASSRATSKSISPVESLGGARRATSWFFRVAAVSPGSARSPGWRLSS